MSDEPAMTTPARKTRTLGVLLFPGFELLDVFGPLEVFGYTDDAFAVSLVAETSDAVRSAQGPRSVVDCDLATAPQFDVILVPGGIGTRTEVDNRHLVDWIAAQARGAELVLAVCTGAALLSRAGVLDGRRATTNKRSFHWVVEQGPRVRWVPVARWVEDGKFVTSAGISAGIDMALHVVAATIGDDVAEAAATRMEYEWQRDADRDRFAQVYGLA